MALAFAGTDDGRRRDEEDEDQSAERTERVAVAYAATGDLLDAYAVVARADQRGRRSLTPGRRSMAGAIGGVHPARSARRATPGKIPSTAPLPAPIARKAEAADVGADAGAAVARASAIPGGSLDPRLQRSLEHALGVDLGGVRVHRDPDADLAARQLSARAFAVGADLYFRDGAYDPTSIEGQRLIAHEVAHTVAGPAAPPHAREVSEPGDGHERAADDFAESYVRALHGDGESSAWRGPAPREHVLVHDALRAPGTSLPGSVRDRFAQALGADLSGVTVHTSPTSASAAAALGTRAFAVGRQVHFADGAYDPWSASGLRLLAHELVHTVQQGDLLPRPDQPLAISETSDAHEHEADRFVEQLAAVDLVDPRWPYLVRPVHIAAVRRPIVSLAPPKSAPGSSSPAGMVIAVGDIELFERKAFTKIWSAGKGSRELIKKQIKVKGLSLDLTLGGEAEATAILSGSYGPGVIHSAIVELDPSDPMYGAAPELMMMGHDAARIALKNAPGTRRASGQLRVPADGGVDVLALAKVEPKIGHDPVGFGLTGGLAATGRADLGAEAMAGVGFTYGDGGVTLSGTYDLDVLLKASFTLLAFLGVFVEVDFSKDFKTPGDKKGGGKPPGLPGGMHSIPSTKPPGWPKEIPWLLPEPGSDPMKPGNDKWRKEWKKSWTLINHRWQHPWELDGKVGVSSILGSTGSSIALPDTTLPISAVYDDLFATAQMNGTDPEDIDKDDDREKKPTGADLEAAKAQFDATAVQAEAKIFDETLWTREKLAEADKIVSSSQGEQLAKWTAVKQSLEARLTTLDGMPNALADMGSRAVAAVGSKEGTPEVRADALAILVELRANAQELTELETRLRRPELPAIPDPNTPAPQPDVPSPGPDGPGPDAPGPAPKPDPDAPSPGPTAPQPPKKAGAPLEVVERGRKLFAVERARLEAEPDMDVTKTSNNVGNGFLNSDGVAELVIKTTGTGAKGGDVFNALLDGFEQRGRSVTGVRAFWDGTDPSMRANLDRFNANRATMSPDDAARNTFTGEMCRRRGLTTPTFEKLDPQSPPHSHVEVVFRAG